jgi:protein-S-isoprenylcysteine O-methyltransferase Ste14
VYQAHSRTQVTALAIFRVAVISIGSMAPRIPPPAIALLAGLVMWGLQRLYPLGQWIVFPWNWLAVLPAAGGLIVASSAFRHFRHLGTTVNPMNPEKATLLVTDGVFRISRNPMYLGLLLLLIGWAIWLGSASVWIIPPAFLFGITLVQILPEERALSALFGARYAEYRREVARWIGLPRSRA